MAYQKFDYYEALKVDSSANTLQIKKAYHEISRIYHPDKALSFDEQQQYKALREAKEKDTELSQSEKNLLNKLEKKIEPFSKAAIAYETLSDPSKREKYDREKGIKKSCSASDPRKRNGCGKKEEAKRSYQAPKTNKKENIESDLLDAIHKKDLQRVKFLISKLNDLEKLDILSSMSYFFVENACNDDDWFKFFKEILSSKQINLGSNCFYNMALKHACNANNRKVVELILIKFILLKKQYQFITH